MTQSSDSQPTRPQRQYPRGAQRYDVLREAEAITATALVNLIELFTMTLTATKEEGLPMKATDDGEQLLIDIVFKPNADGLRLRPEEIQLLLAHISEILREIGDDEVWSVGSEDAATERQSAS